MTNSEIANALGISINLVKVRIHRARRALDFAGEDSENEMNCRDVIG
jgi:DNA-directed RNA polymerase specialized sigma24 family protein